MSMNLHKNVREVALQRKIYVNGNSLIYTQENDAINNNMMHKTNKNVLLQ